ncbi:hypothetical protein LZD49_02630 [Dyadobacter sp. CY261]|uniref:hypothetical protein n=1 Tax=Dyadobacter sp. CY261 TaxID=2907203 RepID=UPI001F32313D|nr:hypothetical protein [Dyadobacter sp. CY261]MCF0069349.1 hypothetical protein [Dyadobacter sp. CY261]
MQTAMTKVDDRSCSDDSHFTVLIGKREGEMSCGTSDRISAFHLSNTPLLMNKQLLLSSLIFCVLACKDKQSVDKQPENPQPTNVLHQHARIVDNESIASFEDSVLVFNQSGLKKPISKQDVLIGTPSAQAKYGFMKKAVDVEEKNGKVFVKVVQAGLDEAFEELHIDTAFTADFDLTNSLRVGRTSEFEFSTIQDIIPGLNVAGSFDVNFDKMNFFYQKGRTSLYPYMHLWATFKINSIGLEVSTSDNQSIEFKQWSFKTIDLPGVFLLVPIGPVVLPIYFGQSLTFNVLPFITSGRLKFAFDPKGNLSMGITYMDGIIRPSITMQPYPQSKDLDPFSFNVEAGLKSTLTLFNPEYSIVPYSEKIMKVSISSPQTIELNIQPPALRPNYKLSYKPQLRAKGYLPFFIKDQPVLDATWSPLDLKIIEGNWKIDTIKILTSHPWKLKNGPVIGFQERFLCTNVKIPEWTLTNGLITFENRASGLWASEVREGLCQNVCSPYEIDLQNCIVTKQPGSVKVSDKNSMNVSLHKNVFSIYNFDRQSENLAWLLYTSELISLTDKRMVLKNAWFNEKNLIFEAP